MDIAEYGTRIIRFRDGRIVSDAKTARRRIASEELAALPPPEPDTPPVNQPAAEPAGAAH
jgi:hypothetical protein